MRQKQIIRNAFIGYKFDVVDMEINRYGQTIHSVLAECVDFRDAQIMLGVDPDAPVRDNSGDRV